LVTRKEEPKMKFVQTIEFQTARFDEIQALEDQWLKATSGTRTLQRQLKTRDLDRPNTYVFIAEFPSYEAAMKNSELPATKEIAEKMEKLADGAPTFRNLEVIDDQTV
jgi:quinol monooxygenase YgiN